MSPFCLEFWRRARQTPGHDAEGKMQRKPNYLAQRAYARGCRACLSDERIERHHVPPRAAGRTLNRAREPAAMHLCHRCHVLFHAIFGKGHQWSGPMSVRAFMLFLDDDAIRPTIDEAIRRAKLGTFSQPSYMRDAFEIAVRDAEDAARRERRESLERQMAEAAASNEREDQQAEREWNPVHPGDPSPRKMKKALFLQRQFGHHPFASLRDLLPCVRSEMDERAITLGLGPDASIFR